MLVKKMVEDIISDTLALLDIEHDPVHSIPCSIPLGGRFQLVVFITEFGYPSFTVTIENNSAIQWTDSDIVEYFIDDETQFFIEKNHVVFTKTSQHIGFSVSYPVEKIQIYNLVAIIKEGMDELDRFIVDFTSI